MRSNDSVMTAFTYRGATREATHHHHEAAAPLAVQAQDCAWWEVTRVHEMRHSAVYRDDSIVRSTTRLSLDKARVSKPTRRRGHGLLLNVVQPSSHRRSSRR
jgi:hypothetical protein